MAILKPLLTPGQVDIKPVTARQKRYTYFIGIDVSKIKLDIAVMKANKLLFHKVIDNDPASIKALIIELKMLTGFTLAKAVFCMENTGIYVNHIMNVMKTSKANLVKEQGIHIKMSMGMIRDKYDEVDAIRIAEYAQKNKDQLRLWIPRRPVLLELNELLNLRERILGLSTALNRPLFDAQFFIKKGLQQQNNRLCKRSVKALQADLDDINLRLDEIIKKDVTLFRLRQIITSVPSIGNITAMQIIISTNEFRDISNSKKFACYSGIAPFKRESGPVHRRARVSIFANKKMKSLLYMCALNAIKKNKDCRIYYERKTIQERKPKMLVINAVKNKLISRVFACVNEDRPYQDDFKQLYHRQFISCSTEETHSNSVDTCK